MHTLFTARAPLLAFVWLAISGGASDRLGHGGVAGPIVAVGASAAHDVLRGVSPQREHAYRVSAADDDGQPTWKCLYSDQRIAASAINDDYCDCQDGSDEPGTSACPNSTFYCHNKGHIPSSILSSRVNDGICDPECCDGSDEYDGIVQCPNVCDRVGRQYRKQRQEEDNVRRAGSKIRAKYIADRKKQLEHLAAELTKLEVEVQVARENEQRAKANVEAAEKMDAHVLQRKQASPLYQTLKTHQGAVRALLDRQADLTSELEKLTNLLDDLAKGYNPNYQDMAVKGAVMAYRAWRRGDDNEEEAAKANQAPIDDEEPQRLNELRAEGEWPSSRLRDIVDADPLTWMDDESFKSNSSVDESGILFRIHEYLPDAIVPYFEAAVDTVLDLLLKANIIAEVKRSKAHRRHAESGGGAEAENVTLARTAHQKAESNLRSIESDLKRKQNDLQVQPEKWGQEGEFKALDGTCVERNMGEYTYEFCFFQGATQKPNRGHGNVSLGKFSKFAPKDSSIQPNDARFYHRQIYDAGQRCWNGPDRSLIVDFTCAPENALLDVFEGEKCIYEAKVSTPAVCLPLESSSGGNDADQATVKSADEGGHRRDEL